MTRAHTADALVTTARRLFARHGYDATSIRAITHGARANLGAVTYHFGSKRALYEAALASLAHPFQQRLAVAAAAGGSALDRIERVVTVFFQYLREQPDFARFIPQVLMSGRAVPRPVHQVMEANHRLIADLIAQGQRNGIIRRGDPRLMALSIGAQPVFLTLMQSALRQAMAIDQKDPATRERVVESVKQFVRAGLSAGGARRRGGTTAGKRRAM